MRIQVSRADVYGEDYCKTRSTGKAPGREQYPPPHRNCPKDKGVAKPAVTMLQMAALRQIEI
jgi:hypothetical protein